MGSFLWITVALANCILGLARHPDQFQKLRENPPALLEPAVEELLRHESQVQFSPRRANQDFEFRGESIRRDQAVIVGLPARRTMTSRGSRTPTGWISRGPRARTWHSATAHTPASPNDSPACTFEGPSESWPAASRG